MLRLTGLSLAFVLMAAMSPITVPGTKGGAAETAIRDPDALPWSPEVIGQRGAGIQAGPAVEETEQDRRAAVAQPVTTLPPETGPDHAGQGDTEPAGTELLNTVSEETEPAETEPLTPIETQSSIRVNANVSLPQDI